MICVFSRCFEAAIIDHRRLTMNSMAREKFRHTSIHHDDGIDILRRTAAAIAIGALGGISCVAAADGTSAWDGDARSAVRLIAGSSAGGGTAGLRAGVEIRLKPGWHTYWRYPGDAGVPPRFSFAGSQNLKRSTCGFQPLSASPSKV